LGQSLFQEEIIGAAQGGQGRWEDNAREAYRFACGSSNLFQSGMSMTPSGFSIR
jgi:hypothetical protein